MGLREQGLRESLRPQGLKQGGLRGSLRNLDSTPPEIPDSGVARYTFDDADTSGSTATDVWGSNDATINGATTGVLGANQTYNTNEAYSFDGSDDSVTTDLADFGLPFSWAVWVYYDGLIGSNSPAISTRTSNGNGGGLRERGNNQWEFYLNNQVQVSTSTDYANEWVHLVATADGGTNRLYANGSEVDSASFSGYSTGNDYRIGERADGNGNFGGDLDDIRIYDKALTATEVSNLYNTGSING